MDDLIWHWMFQSWIYQQEKQHKFAEDYSLFIGSFANPAMAQKIIKKQNPDHQMSDEDFDQLSDQIKNQSQTEVQNKLSKLTRRKRKLLSQQELEVA